jgi:uncharacterized protein (DUF1810 family)
MTDEHDLDRFVQAQSTTYEAALSELRAGRKRTHWMWFVFPQLRGLGRSGTARYYGIASLAEARAYLAHEVLGPRLTECSWALLDHRGHTAHEIMGSPDDIKLRSSMTLFAAASGKGSVFADVLDAYFDGRPDPLTTGALGSL